MGKNSSSRLQYFTSNLYDKVNVLLHLLCQIYNYRLLLGETQLQPDRPDTRVSFQEQRPKDLGINKVINVLSQHGGIGLPETVPNS